MRPASRLLLALAGGVAWAGPGQACTISATGVAFGAYDPRAAAPDDSTGSVYLDCPNSVKDATVTIGAGGSGSYAPRRMSSGANQLDYSLYTNSTRTTVWGNGSGGTSSVSVGKGFVGSLTVYGRIPPSQNVRAGTYTDTVTVTVTF